MWKVVKRREFAILDFASSARDPSCRVGNGFGKRNAARRTIRMAFGLILNEIWKSKMEIPG